MDEQHFEYRTGRTQPQKSSSGLITAMLICIIALCGVISVMGLMNIRLTHLLEDARQEGPPLSFYEGEDIMSIGETDTTLAGMVLQELPVAYQQLHELPRGLYVSHVDVCSPAASLGILPGDVLVCFDGTGLSALAELDALKTARKSGETVELRICRDGQDLQFTLTMP